MFLLNTLVLNFEACLNLVTLCNLNTRQSIKTVNITILGMLKDPPYQSHISKNNQNYVILVWEQMTSLRRNQDLKTLAISTLLKGDNKDHLWQMMISQAVIQEVWLKESRYQNQLSKEWPILFSLNTRFQVTRRPPLIITIHMGKLDAVWPEMHF